MHRRHLLHASAIAGSMFGVSAKGAVLEPKPLPGDTLFHSNPEAYWNRIRDEQFLLPGWRAFLNNGSLGIAPVPVVKAVSDYLASSAGLEMEYYPRWGYEQMDEFRQELSDFYGCKKEELALMHNATEAMSTIAAGLDLKAGEEVLLTDQEHPSGRGCWYMRAARQGIQVREVKIPLPPKSPEQIADLLISAIGPRTRVISFSGITTTTGLITPVRQICEAARSKGVISVVDGAHMHGQIPFRISELNCDYMAGSPHKWVFAPAGCGLLYIREDNLEKLWPTIVSGSWNDTKLKAGRFMVVGTNNRSIMEGMMAGLKFAKEIGPERIHARAHQLARHLFQKARECQHVDLLTPDDDRMFGALVTVKFKTGKLDKFHELLAKRRIWCFRGEQVRLSTHIHTRPQDVDLYFDTIREALG
ncbi:MAG TPA: aminotransferase class V-fold PLP-dependent enzyme [Bryobacteraceae bacterium]|nr:aminotransferase class V-fold PLP-dependent enzyme [Bryobacteraceae bacterium]